MSPLLAVKGLTVDYHGMHNAERAVDGVSFSIARGETLALVGESGSGKSTIAHALMRLIPRGAGSVSSGSIAFEGQDLLALPEAAMRAVRGGRIAMVFQDPMMALNPVHRVGRQIAESLLAHGKATPRTAIDRAIELLTLVGVPAPEKRARQYPHNLSGGMRQRVMIAIALAGDPALLIADEPTTALDVTVQAQVLAEIAAIKSRLGMAMLLITHDLAVVSETADRVIVMYAGRMVEEGNVEGVFSRPAHPYTRGLLEATDWEGAASDRMREIPGSVPNQGEMPPGCAFAPRCAIATERCRIERPSVERALHGGGVSCFAAGSPS